MRLSAAFNLERLFMLSPEHFGEQYIAEPVPGRLNSLLHIGHIFISAKFSCLSYQFPNEGLSAFDGVAPSHVAVM